MFSNDDGDHDTFSAVLKISNGKNDNDYDEYDENLTEINKF